MAVPVLLNGVRLALLIMPVGGLKRGVMAGQFEGKVVLITGASGGLGQAVTRRFAREGAKLVLVERNIERLNVLASQIVADHSSSIMTMAVDVSVPEAIDLLMAAAHERFGRIDILVHTVGGYAAGKTVAEGDLDIWDKMMNLNARPVYLMGGRAAARMLEQGGGGKIVFVLARSGLKGSSKHSAYSASKAAAERVMESLSAEVRDQGIQVNAVLPGVIDTPLNRAEMPDADFSKWASPEQIADAIAFLASDQASAVHGVSLAVYNRA